MKPKEEKKENMKRSKSELKSEQLLKQHKKEEQMCHQKTIVMLYNHVVYNMSVMKLTYDNIVAQMRVTQASGLQTIWHTTCTGNVLLLEVESNQLRIIPL